MILGLEFDLDDVNGLMYHKPSQNGTMAEGSASRFASANSSFLKASILSEEGLQLLWY